MLTVADLMTSPVKSLLKVDSLLDARNLMKMQNIRHIPVTDAHENFEGLITNRDLLSYTISSLAEIDTQEQEGIDKEIMTYEIMKKDVLTVAPDMPLKEAASILHKHKYGCLPVVENRKLIGIVTEADFLKLTIKLLEAMDD